MKSDGRMPAQEKANVVAPPPLGDEWGSRIMPRVTINIPMPTNVVAPLDKAAQPAHRAAKATTIFVELLRDGVRCWRPVQAIPLDQNAYCIVGAVPSGEEWQFQPGEVVRCEMRRFGDGSVPAAYESVAIE